MNKKCLAALTLGMLSAGTLLASGTFSIPMGGSSNKEAKAGLKLFKQDIGKKSCAQCHKQNKLKRSSLKNKKAQLAELITRCAVRPEGWGLTKDKIDQAQVKSLAAYLTKKYRIK